MAFYICSPPILWVTSISSFNHRTPHHHGLRALWNSTNFFKAMHIFVWLFFKHFLSCLFCSLVEYTASAAVTAHWQWLKFKLCPFRVWSHIHIHHWHLRNSDMPACGAPTLTAQVYNSTNMSPPLTCQWELGHAVRSNGTRIIQSDWVRTQAIHDRVTVR